MGSSADTASVSIREASDIRRAAEALRDIADRLGPFWVVAADNIASKQPMVDADGNVLAAAVFGHTGSSQLWWMDTRLALNSPLARAARYESEPFWANADGFRTRNPNRYLDAIDLSNFEKRALTRAAIVVPVHLPFGQIGMTAFGARDPGRTDLAAEYEAHADTLALLTQRFISGYAKAMRTRQWLPADCQLTKREIECLRWAAVGKTDKEISLILARSHATVRFHIQNAGEKLNAVNRSQTIFKAAQLGYLGLAN
jgi:DNA-binding CsgD family transcriptional regulator